MSEKSSISESDNVLNEVSYFKNRKSIGYNIDKFENGECIFLFITFL